LELKGQYGMKVRQLVTGAAAAALMIGVAIVPMVAAATTIVVTPSNQQGWTTDDTRPGGAVNFVVDASAPAGSGALQLTTNATITAKAQYLHGANTPLADVAELSYYTKQNSALFPAGDPSYQVIAFLTGTSGFTTLVFEPYQNPLQGLVVNNVWQQWDVDAGLFWSTRTVTCSNGTVVGTPGGPATYTLAQISSTCPNAVVIGFGVNIGTNNPGYDVETDLLNFNGTVYDFEPTLSPTDKNSCKDGGWQTFNTPSFNSQGDCIKYVNTGK
jgi:hypothetical protein